MTTTQSSSPTITVVQAWSTAYRGETRPNDTAEHVYQYVAAATAAGARWDWDAAEENLDAAYAAVGEENPATGYDWHRGWHPLQHALREAIAHIMGD
jgi:2-oxoglutarate dehydrogenase complex dehydrogenase (E1) component-like enzyme